MSRLIVSAPAAVTVEDLEARCAEETFDANGSRPAAPAFAGPLPAVSLESDESPALPPQQVHRTSLQALKAKARNIEQRAHLWLYRHKYLKEEVVRLRAMLEDSNSRLAGALAQLQNIVPSVRSIEPAVQLVHRLEHEMDRLRGEVQFQRRRLARLAEDKPEPSGEPRRADAPLGQPRPINLSLLYARSDRSGGAEARMRLEPLLELIKRRRPVAPGRPLLDIGCGAGTWLRVACEAGIEAYGIDRDEDAVALCCQLGLPARNAEAFSHLAQLPGGSLGAITALHLIDDLTIEQVACLIDEAYRTLVPGGLLLLQAVNPENLRIAVLRMTRRGAGLLLSPDLLACLVQSRGFGDVHVTRFNPSDSSECVNEDSEAARRINALLYGPADFAIAATRL